ncbi:MAG: glycosyltransferase family 2 protein [Nitrospira sp.]|nr:glycosyltransferase family 2 protein [Nitrospira sp.]
MTSGDDLDLSIAIVSYNTRTLVLDCLKSVFETSGKMTVEVILVDNNSHDGTPEAVRNQYPTMSLIVNPQNRGFSKAVNQALEVSCGRYLLMLNSDTRLHPHALEHMVTSLDREPDIGAVGCKQWTEDGRMYQSCFPFPSVRDHLTYAAFFRRCAPGLQGALASKLAIDCSQSQDVDWINGACLMVRRDLMKACGGLDEGYFMYFEDIDLCRAIRKKGYRIRHMADADVTHLIGRSGERHREQLNLVWEFSRIRYVEKHFSLFARWIMKTWIATGAIVRLISSVIGSTSTAQGEAFGTTLSIISRILTGKRSIDSELAWNGQGRG